MRSTRGCSRKDELEYTEGELGESGPRNRGVPLAGVLLADWLGLFSDRTVDPALSPRRSFAAKVPAWGSNEEMKTET
jgi:hypothetical protein